MAYMTDAEAERLDEYYTKNTIIPIGGKEGVLDRLRKSLRPGEVMFSECIIEEDENELDAIFDGAKEIGECELATAANA
jgi:hypothetical protein